MSSSAWRRRSGAWSSTPTAIRLASPGFGLPVVADTIAGFVGPLAGVLAGMRWSAANAPEARWIVTAAGDAPMLPADLVSRLTAAVANRDGAIALAKSAGGVHPVIGLWPVALAADLEDQLRCRRAQGARLDGPAWHRGGRFSHAPYGRRGGRPVLQRQYAARAGRAAGPAGKVRRMRRPADTTPIIGIVGWKKSGKTTLVTRLIAELTARGLRIATVKHAHHDFQIDDKETDSARHRRAGAAQVAVVSAKRWALINELAGCAGAAAGGGGLLAGPVRPRHRRGLQGGADPEDRTAAPRSRRASGRWPTPIRMSSRLRRTTLSMPGRCRCSGSTMSAAIADFIVGAVGLARQAGAAAARLVE